MMIIIFIITYIVVQTYTTALGIIIANYLLNR